MTGSFPSAVSAREQVLNGTVAVAAGGGQVCGVIAAQAEAFLVRDGRVVTLPVPQDAIGQTLTLADGRVEWLPAVATLAPCAGDDVLSAGTYDLYVRVVLNLDDSSQADSFGGPWPLEVR